MRWRTWPDNALRSTDIADTTRFTFSLEMTVVAVLDSDKNDITEQYMVGGAAEEKVQAIPVAHRQLASRVDSLTVKFNEITETLLQIQQQMNEEGKEDGSGLQQQIDELTVSVHKLLSHHNKANDSASGAFRHWVLFVLNLPEYLDLFKENGVDTLDVAAMLTVKELSMMGIKKIGHKMQILSAVAQLKQTSKLSPAQPGGSITNF